VSLHDQQLLAEEQNLAVLVTQQQAGQQRIDWRQKEQMEVVEHGREGRRGREEGQDGRRERFLSSFNPFFFQRGRILDRYAVGW
jgi:hypothetical protein